MPHLLLFLCVEYMQFNHSEYSRHAVEATDFMVAVVASA